MKVLTKFLTVLLALCIGLCCFAACGTRTEGDNGDDNGNGGYNPPPVVDGDEEEGKTNLVVGITSDTSEREMMQAVIAAYEAEHTDVNINIMQIAGNYSQQIVNLASSGELPDVYMNYDTLVGYLAESNVSLDLTEYLAQYGIAEGDFYPSIFELGRVNGKVYMLPREYAHVVVYYNKEILQDAGVDTSVIRNGWTWEQFESVAAQLVQKRGAVVTRYGADLQLNWPTTVLSYIYGMGGTLFSEDKTRCTIDDPATVAAYQALKSKVDDGVYTNVFRAGTPTFLNGSVGMYFSVRTQANTVNRTLGEGNWDVVSFPEMSGAEQYVGSGTTGYSVSSYSEHRDAAIDFLMFMMSEEGMSVMAQTGLIIPSRMSMNTADAAWRNYPNADINQDAFVYMPERDMLPLSSYISNPGNTTRVTDALNLATESLLINADASQFAQFRDSITTAIG